MRNTPSEWFWAQVDAVRPLRVKRNGTSDAVDADPLGLIDQGNVAIGDLVWCQLALGKVVVIGRMGGTPAMMAGVVTVDMVANQNTVKHMELPSGVFTGTPAIFLTAYSSVPDNMLSVTYTSPSATGFDIVGYRTSTTHTGVSWMVVEIR